MLFMIVIFNSMLNLSLPRLLPGPAAGYPGRFPAPQVPGRHCRHRQASRAPPEAAHNPARPRQAK